MECFIRHRVPTLPLSYDSLSLASLPAVLVRVSACSEPASARITGEKRKEGGGKGEKRTKLISRLKVA